MILAVREHLPALVVIIPLIFAFILPPLSRRLRLIENLTIVGAVLSLGAAAWLAFIVYKTDISGIDYQMGGWAPPWGILLRADNLAVFFLLLVALVHLPISLYSKGRLLAEVGSKVKVARFYALYLLLIAALSGMALTKDLFNVFVLVEVATISCCALVSAQSSPRAAKASFTYLILATLGSSFVLAGIGFIYISTGQLNMGFAAEGLTRVWQDSPRLIWLAFCFMLVGFGVKSALFPLHIWLPDAHSTAPAPASAVLSGLAVKGYIICLLKILYDVFGQILIQQFAVGQILFLAGVIAILAGSVFALLQDELKRRLAYSTVAQVGYIFLGLGLVNETGLSGGLFYLASHAFSKAALFLAAGAMLAATGKQKIKDLAGIGHKMPFTMAAFTIGSLSLIGIPLFSGFVGKWQLLLGSLDRGSVLALGGIIIGSVLCAAYLLPVIRLAYFEPASLEQLEDPGLTAKISLGLLSLGILVLGVFPGPFLELAKRAAGQILGQG